MVYETTPRVVTASLGEQIADAIRHEILLGKLHPGETLSQETVCGRYGTSRMPVRDALRQLVLEGVLVPSSNGQVEVVRFTRHDIGDMFDVCGLVCGRLTLRATERQTEADMVRLRDLHVQMTDSLDQGRLSELWELNVRFHGAIEAVGRSPKLEMACRVVTIELHRVAMYQTFERSQRSNEEHEQILEAMAAGDGQGAAELVSTHVTEARDDVIRHLENIGVLVG